MIASGRTSDLSSGKGGIRILAGAAALALVAGSAAMAWPGLKAVLAPPPETTPAVAVAPQPGQPARLEAFVAATAASAAAVPVATAPLPRMTTPTVGMVPVSPRGLPAPPAVLAATVADAEQSAMPNRLPERAAAAPPARPAPTLAASAFGPSEVVVPKPVTGAERVVSSRTGSGIRLRIDPRDRWSVGEHR